MTNFTSILNNVTVASTESNILITNNFQNISSNELLTKLKMISIGEKNGSHFLRTNLITNNNGECLPRENSNTESTANILIIDCDKRITSDGEVIEGAPDPIIISQILQSYHIGHILYGSYSHYVGNKGNRYRIIIITKTPYTKSQLAPTLEAQILLINSNLTNVLLDNATENHTWSQPWFYPRKPSDSQIEMLYLEYLEGDAIEVLDSIETPSSTKKKKRTFVSKDGELSAINAFNEQYPLPDLLIQYGYKKIYSCKEYDKWLSPDSSSGIAGITVIENKFFSHHGSCQFHDGYWHDAFDLMHIKEGLSEKDAVMYAAQNTIASNGRTVDEHNKSLASKRIDSNTIANPISQADILAKLLDKIPPVSFRKVANITDDKMKLKSHHYYVIVIETILQLSKQHNWGLCRNHDFIYAYNGTYWNLIEKDDLEMFLGKAAEKMTVDKYWARFHNFRDQLLKQFIALAHLPKPKQPKEIVFINLKNGTFEITPTSTRLKIFDPNDFITYQLPFEYDINATAPLFQTYLNKVLPDKQLQNILSEYLGYVFIRPTTLKLEKTLLLYGKGANGKSVFYEIVRNLLGEQNISEYSLQTLTNDSGYQRAMIGNKLVNYASEINSKLEASIFKQLVSGEAVEARLPYGRPFIMNDYAKLIFNCNDLPKDVEQTNAYFRRFLIIPFNVTISEHEQDKQLSKKIIDSELPGVFNWVLEGLKRLLAQKNFTDSDIIHQTRAQYEKESDSVRLFLEEANYTPSIESYISMKDLYREYQCFCQENGYHRVNNLNFKKRLEYAKIIVMKKNVGQVVYVSKIYEYTQT